MLLLLYLLLSLVQQVFAAITQNGSSCTVTPLGTNALADDTPQILSAFKQCGQNGSIVFLEGTYYIRQVMDVTGLQNVDVSIYGTFVWSTDVQYWLSHSISVVYAGRSTAWRIGGSDIAIRGHGRALFDGNGQTWYDENKNAGNQNGRPIAFTLWNAKNVLVDGISWRQSQFWHTFVAHSENVTMTNLNMNSTSNSQWKTVNTDGTDTWNSKDVTISNWTVTCGDDCISIKGNSTLIHVSNITCYSSGGMCIGSVGASSTSPDYVSDITFSNITLSRSSNAAWIKTYPAARGYVRDVLFSNIAFTDVNQPIYITSCIYSDQNCDASRLEISNVTWRDVKGTSRYNVGAGMHCSAAKPCEGLVFEDVDIRPVAGGKIEYLCSNIVGEESMGLNCTGSCPAGWAQQLSGNH